MLEGLLKSIGKVQFVWNFDLLKRCGENHGREECISGLMERNISNEAGAATRCSCAIRVFENNQQCEALKIISNSRVPQSVKQESIRLLKKMKIFFLIFGFFLLSGCAANLEDFQEMSSHERTEYICNNHREIEHLSSNRNSASRAIREITAAIERGYRIHDSCKEVLVPSTESCSYTESTINCTQSNKYATVCEEVPVAIDGYLEKEKLESYEDDYSIYSAQLNDKISQCRTEASGLGVEEAFDYYQRVK